MYKHMYTNTNIDRHIYIHIHAYVQISIYAQLFSNDVVNTNSLIKNNEITLIRGHGHGQPDKWVASHGLLNRNSRRVMQYATMSTPDNHLCYAGTVTKHDDVIKWKHFPRYWTFVREIHRSPVNSPHRGQWRGALMFSLICAWTNGCANNRDVCDLRRRHAHYDVIVMSNWEYGELRRHTPEFNPCKVTAKIKHTMLFVW